MNDSHPPELDRAEPAGRNRLSRILGPIRWAAIGLIILFIVGLGIMAIGGIVGQSRWTPLPGWLTDRIGGNIPPSPTYTLETPEGAAIGGPFQLIDDHGRSVTDADYRGRWMLVF